MVSVSFDVSGAKSIINRWKQQDFWEEIADEALNEISDDIENSVKSQINKTNLKSHTNRLKDSIVSFIINNELYVGSTHPAMALVEYGGYSPFPNPESATIKEYANIYGQSTYVVARGIFRNQPYAEGRHPIQKGVSFVLQDGRLNKITYRIAKERSGN